MGNLNDFDLDLRKFAENGSGRGIENSFSSFFSITTVVCSMTGELSEYSVEHCGDPSNAATPTTGMTVNCCTKEGGNVPNCV